LFKEIVDGRTHGRWTTDNGPSQKLTFSTLCSCELKKLYKSWSVVIVNVYVIHVLLKLWLHIKVQAVACKQFSGIFTFPESGTVNRFLITT